MMKNESSIKKIEGSRPNSSDEKEEHPPLVCLTLLHRQDNANTQFNIFRGLGIEGILPQKGLAIKL